MKTMRLSKSRFKLAVECPRKLTYVSDKRYASAFDDNDFLNALADGGHQVGALAKLLYPQGVEVASPPECQVADTQALLVAPSIVLFEPTFQYQNLLVRVDILVKRGNEVQLIEVKSKSLGQTEGFRGARGNLTAEWRPYLEDVAFQTHVVSKTMPSWSITPFLLLIDPNAVCHVDSLGTRVAVSRNGNRVSVAVDPTLRAADVDLSLFVQRDVEAEVREILSDSLELNGLEVPFINFIQTVADKLAAGEDFEPRPSSACKACEFYCDPEKRSDAHRSGWAECMARYTHQPMDVPRAATVFGLCGERNTEKWLHPERLLLRDLTLDPEEAVDSITTSHRHALQVEEAQGNTTRVIHYEKLREAFDSWQFPLHFIDFETARPAIPFHRGHTPNQQLLFQFSHHSLDERGSLAHRSQCLETTPGAIPNAPVIRALREALGSDPGTVIHWWTHERTVLGDIRKQLDGSKETDRRDLVAFIDSLLIPKKGPGARLVDLGLPLVSKLTYFAGTDGRSSIKKVLPAVLQQSVYLQDRYGQPIYGTAAMPSLNFLALWKWVQFAAGRVRDPYELLAPIFTDPAFNASVANAEAADDSSSPFVANGGAAMIAYGELQRQDMTDLERNRYEDQLKRYCELDSLAMVMIYEALRQWLNDR